MSKKKYHSLCRWTFNAGKGGFVPGNMRPAWSAEKLNTVSIIDLISKKIKPRIPADIELGYEVHFDSEVTEKNAAELADILSDNSMYLAMVTPGAHTHYAYGGICSMDDEERSKANDLSLKTVDIAYGPLKKAWHADIPPCFVIWNGSFGYDLAGIHIRNMYRNLKKSVADLAAYEAKKGGELYFGIEPKPNEGHPAMLLPTVASAILFWHGIEKEYGINIEKKGINKEFGHSEMIGLDLVYDTVEEIEYNALTHMHLNSQGYNDGISLGGPGKYDIDNSCRVNGFNIVMAELVNNAGYNRWKGHDIQARPYDNEEQAVDRVLRSILSWHACEIAAAQIDENTFINLLKKRETGAAEDILRQAVVNAQLKFNELGKNG